MLTPRCARFACAMAVSATLSASAAARQVVKPQDPAHGSREAVASKVTVPPDYVIGREDVLSIVFWGERELSAEVVVRPDGKISLPLLKDVPAAGYTPEQLTDVVVKAASKYVGNPNATVMVKEINSRKVFVIGRVGKPGGFSLVTEMTVLELIALAGDVQEYAKAKDIVVVRKEDGREHRYKFNYGEVVRGKKTEQNILLKPGDMVIVP